MAVPVLLQDKAARVPLCLLSDTPRSMICWGGGCQDRQPRLVTMGDQASARAVCGAEPSGLGAVGYG